MGVEGREETSQLKLKTQIKGPLPALSTTFCCVGAFWTFWRTLSSTDLHQQHV